MSVGAQRGRSERSFNRGKSFTPGRKTVKGVPEKRKEGTRGAGSEKRGEIDKQSASKSHGRKMGGEKRTSCFDGNRHWDLGRGSGDLTQPL